MPEPSTDASLLGPPEPGGTPGEVMRSRIATALFAQDAQPQRIGRFEIIEQLGVGGMGVVYRAHDPSLGRDVAVKVLHREGVSTPHKARLLREAQALAKLNHPNVVSVFEVGEHNARVFIAMEYVAGVSAKQWRSASPRPWRQVVRLYLQAGEGLVAAHAAGIVHRDFKPANILIGDDDRVRVADFGLARADASSGSGEGVSSSTALRLPESQLTRTGALVGTPAYMAPEQLRGAAAAPASDQFSYCVALWEALTGHRPFAPEQLWRGLAKSEHLSEPAKATAIPRRVRMLLVRGLAFKTESRFDSMLDLVRRLEAASEPRRWRLAALAVVGAAAAASLASSKLDSSAARCDEVDTRARSLWDSPTRSATAQAFSRPGAPFGPRAFERVDEGIEAEVEAWRQTAAQACDGGDSVLARRRRACLDRHADAIAELTAVLRGASLPVIGRADRLVLALPNLAACAPEVLRGEAAFHAPQALARQEQAVRAGAHRALLLRAAGDYAGALASAQHADATAQTTEFAPLQCEASVAVAEAAFANDDFATAADRSAQAVAEGLSGGHDPCTFDALTLEARVAAVREESKVAEHAADRALALLSTLDDAPTRRARAFDAVAAAAGAAGHRSREADALRAAIAAWREADNAFRAAASTMHLATALNSVGEHAQAGALYASVVQQYVAALGANHPEVGAAEFNWGAQLLESDPDAATRHLHSSLEIETASFGPESPAAARTRLALGTAAMLRDDCSAAITHALSARRIFLRDLGPEDETTREPLKILGWCHRVRGELERSLAAYDDLIEGTELETSCEEEALHARVSWAESIVPTGQLDRGEYVYDSVEDCFHDPTAMHPVMRGLLLKGRGRIALGRAKPNTARRQLGAALAILRNRTDVDPLNIQELEALLENLGARDSDRANP